jgi:serine/threonine protein kinase
MPRGSDGLMAHPSDRAGSGDDHGSGTKDRQGERSEDARGLSFADPLIGRIIGGNFRVLKLIGTGAMGHVYQAEQLSLGKMVALKLLRNELMGDDKLIKRFELEARNASQLNHPNSIQIIDFGRDRDLLYIAMELLPGVDLGQLILREGPLPLGRIARIMDQVLAALDEAHAQGIVHRDLKPGNIMLVSRRGEPDFVKVCDFGIAKAQTSREGAGLTMKGLVCGTPEYMSPEQARGEEVDGRSDLYAVGVILYQLVTGELPFTASSPVGILSKHLAEPPLRPTMRRPGLVLPPAFERVILRALAKDAEDRPQTPVEMRHELRASVSDTGEWSLGSPSLYAPAPGASSSRELPTQPTTPMNVAMGGVGQSGGLHGAVTSRAGSGDLLPGAISRSRDGHGTASTRRASRGFLILLGLLALGAAGTVLWMQRSALWPPATTGAVTSGPPVEAVAPPAAVQPHATTPAVAALEEAPAAAVAEPAAPGADSPAPAPARTLAAAAAERTPADPGRQRRGNKRGRRPQATTAPAAASDGDPTLRPEAPTAPAPEAPVAPPAVARAVVSAPTHADQNKEQPMKEAERLLAQGEVASACKKGEEQRTMTPKLPGIYKFLGKCYMRAGQPERAKDNYRRYLELAPDASDAAFIKSIVR